jgi:hypothetical protein
MTPPISGFTDRNDRLDDVLAGPGRRGMPTHWQKNDDDADIGEAARIPQPLGPMMPATEKSSFVAGAQYHLL